MCDLYLECRGGFEFHTLSSNNASALSICSLREIQRLWFRLLGSYVRLLALCMVFICHLQEIWGSDFVFLILTEGIFPVLGSFLQSLGVGHILLSCQFCSSIKFSSAQFQVVLILLSEK